MDSAGPSRPRAQDRRDTTPGTSVFDADAYDDDADDLPGYSVPGPSRPSGEEEGEGSGRRLSGERLLNSGAARGNRREEPEGGTSAEYGRGRAGLLEHGEEEPLQAMGMTQGEAQRKAAWWRSTLITALFVCAWYGSATLLSIYNKWMFSAEYYNFPFPLFVTACHMVVQFSLAGAVRLIWAHKYRPLERPTRQDYVAKIFPTAISTAGDIGLSNLSLRTITLSLYTMCKSSALIFVLIFAFIFRLERFSLNLIGVITLISAGVFLMVFDTTSVNLPGIIMVFSASALSGLRWALTETLMKKKSMGLSNPFATIFWLAPLMAIVLIPVSIGVEGWKNVFGSGHFEGTSAWFTVLVIAFPGAIAFAMVTSEYFIIDRAGILPLSVAGVFKEVTTISISAWVFGDQLTNLNIVGVAIAVCGIALFSYHKYNKAMSSSADEDSPLILPTPTSSHPGQYALAPSADEVGLASPGSVPMSQLPSLTKLRGHKVGEEGDADSVMQKRRDDFEGWNDSWSEEGEGEEEDDDEEVLQRRKERVGENGIQTGGRSWGKWWDKEV